MNQNENCVIENVLIRSQCVQRTRPSIPGPHSNAYNHTTEVRNNYANLSGSFIDKIPSESKLMANANSKELLF